MPKAHISPAEERLESWTSSGGMYHGDPQIFASLDNEAFPKSKITAPRSGEYAILLGLMSL